MRTLDLWVILALSVIGIFCIINVVLLQNLRNSPEDREIELLLTGDNAEFLLRKTIRTARGSDTKIIAVCLDQEAAKICEFFCRGHPNILCRRSFDEI